MRIIKKKFSGRKPKREEIKESRMERIYKTMRNTGAGAVTIGIIILVTGVTVGIVSIVNGAILLKRKSEITF